jgi:hypothetical protein
MQSAGYATSHESIPATYSELDDRYGAKVEEMLAHWLDDERLARGLRRPVLAAVAQNSHQFDPGQEAPDDWVFGEARREARRLIGPEGVAGVVPVMRKPARATPPPSFKERAEADDDDEPSDRRIAVPSRWIWFGAFMGLMAGALAYASMMYSSEPYPEMASVRPAPPIQGPPLAVEPVRITPPPQGLPRIDRGSDASPAQVLPRLQAAPAPAPPPFLPALDAEAASDPLPPPTITAVDQPLEPLHAPAPPALTDLTSILPETPEPSLPPPSTPPATPPPTPPVEQAGSPHDVPPPARVFIHYSAVNSSSRDRAERLATTLRRQGFRVAGIRSVPFQIGEPSVRYFFADNAADADALVELSSHALPRLAGLAGRGPTDFTHFSPKPRPGTLEIWIPAS